MIALLGCLLPISAQNDLIILRNGREFNVSIVQVNDQEVNYKESDKKNSTEFTTPTAEIYMLKFAKRGNVYITNDGTRITGENQIIPRDADVIYLVSGKEIPAYDLRVMKDRISFLLKKNKNTKIIPIAEVFPRTDVFMIRYSDGTKDILTDITIRRHEREESVEQRKTTPVEEADEELQVVFHQVSKGETISSIAQKYNIAESDIISWNDLPAKFKSTAKLQPDMQLMLYVKPTKNTP